MYIKSAITSLKAKKDGKKSEKIYLNNCSLELNF